jgi:hypothetical protein
MTVKPISERDLVLVADPETKKLRPGIVLETKLGRQVILIAGTGTPRDLPRVEVRPESRAGKALGFYKPTYFYASNERVVAMTEVISTGRVCPPELFLQLRVFVKSAAR